MPALKSPVTDSGNIVLAIAENVRRIRITRGLKQSELAALSGCTQAAISHIERGIRDPSATTLIAIAEALDASLDEIAGR